MLGFGHTAVLNIGQLLLCCCQKISSSIKSCAQEGVRVEPIISQKPEDKPENTSPEKQNAGLLWTLSFPWDTCLHSVDTCQLPVRSSEPTGAALSRPHPAGICQASLPQTSSISNPWKRLCGPSSPTHGSSQLALRGTP